MSANALKVLLVEDNPVIARQITEFFENQQWQVDYASKGQQGETLACTQMYDVVILDLGLPDIDGTRVCERIKANAQTFLPVLMLTARDGLASKAEGFGAGADDYVTKPFDLNELKMRCLALAKRHLLHQSKEIVVGDLKLDCTSRTAERGGVPLQLTSKGFIILSCLAKAYPHPVTRSSLIHQLWGDFPPDSDALKSHIYSLRNTLDKPFDHAMLHTIPQTGFKLVVSHS